MGIRETAVSGRRRGTVGAPLNLSGHDATTTDRPPAGAKTRKEWWDHWGLASRGQAHHKVRSMIRDGYMEIVGRWGGVDYIRPTGKKRPEPPPASFTVLDYAREMGLKERTARDRLRRRLEDGTIICVGEFVEPAATRGGKITRYYVWA